MPSGQMSAAYARHRAHEGGLVPGADLVARVNDGRKLTLKSGVEALLRCAYGHTRWSDTWSG